MTTAHRQNARPSYRRRAVGVTVAALAAAVPLAFPTSYDLARFELTIVIVLAAIGFNFAFGIGGQLAIGQPVIVAVGAYTAGILSVTYDWGVERTLVPAILASVLASLVLGLPSLRIRGWYFAISSFFAVAILPDVIELLSDRTGGGRGLVGIAGFSVGGTRLEPWVVYEFFLLALIACFAGVSRLSRSGWGLSLRLLRAHPLASAATGLDPVRAKAWVYVVSAIPCGVAGAMYAHSVRYLAPTVFSFELVLVIIGGTFLGGVGTMWGPLLGVALFQVISLWIGPFSVYNQLFLGLAVLTTAVAFNGGIVGVSRRLASRLRRSKLAAEPALSGSMVDAGAETRDRSRFQPAGLRVVGVEKHFGGNHVLTGIDLEVPAGQMVGFVGANGSGKTTLLNIVSGFVPPDSGAVYIGGEPVTGLASHRVAAKGLARTFQVPQLVDELTVVENIELGEIGLGRQRVFDGLLRPPGFARRDRDRAKRAVAVARFLGLDDVVMDTAVGSLPLGLKRITEIGRAIAADAPIVCLDEPAAGLSDAERVNLGVVLSRLTQEGRTVLLIEHHLRFVLEHCRRVVLLDRGRITAEGDTAQPADWDRRLTEYFGTFLLDVAEEPTERGPTDGQPADHRR